MSINDDDFNSTVESAPTEIVSITNIESDEVLEEQINKIIRATY